MLNFIEEPNWFYRRKIINILKSIRKDARGDKLKKFKHHLIYFQYHYTPMLKSLKMLAKDESEIIRLFEEFSKEQYNPAVHNGTSMFHYVDNNDKEVYYFTSIPFIFFFLVMMYEYQYLFDPGIKVMALVAVGIIVTVMAISEYFEKIIKNYKTLTGLLILLNATNYLFSGKIIEMPFAHFDTHTVLLVSSTLFAVMTFFRFAFPKTLLNRR